MNDQDIKDYFIFDDADLDANRNGKLSEKQQKKLKQQDKNAKKFNIPAAIFFFAIASILPIIFFPMAISSWQQHDLGGVFGSSIGSLVWLLVWGGIGYFFLNSFFNDKHSISKITLKKVEGPVNYVSIKSETGDDVKFTLHVGKTKLDVVYDHLRSAMKEGDIYAIYFYKFKDSTGNHVLSAEWISKGEILAAASPTNG